MTHPKIYSATAVNDHVLLIEFDNAEKRLYDIKPLLTKKMFQPLKNSTLFRNVQVETGGYAVYWNSDIDLSEYELWIHGNPVDSDKN